MWIMVDCRMEIEIKDGFCNNLKHTTPSEKSDTSRVFICFHDAPQHHVEKGIAFAIELMETKY